MNTSHRIKKGLFVIALFLGGIACGESGGNTPTSPTATAPDGCSGQPITNVSIGLGSMGGGVTQRFTAEVFGATFTGQAPPMFMITRNVVPCEYELRGQIVEANSPVFVLFGFPPGTRAPDTGGIDPASIVVLAGPDPRQPAGGTPGCMWTFGGFGMTLPADFRMRFRVVAGLRDGSRC